jgi:alpha-glucosidase (family GH31 glycosyl hydrolase)
MGRDGRKAERIEFNCTDPAFMHAYFEELHHPHEQKGVDFWWIDWQQGTKCQLEGLDPLPWLNHLHARDLEKRGKRPLIVSRYGGLGGGRFPVGFSGDALGTWDTLALEAWFTAMASNVLFGYWSHDIGGIFPTDRSPELFTRWVQFGAFSPVGLAPQRFTAQSSS